jgi:hypothetical protein
MGTRKRLRTAVFIPVLLAVLACSAWAGPSVRKGSHYPGQDCSGCHKFRGKDSGKMPAKPSPVKTTPPKATTGAGAAGSKTDPTPAKRATQPR